MAVSPEELGLLSDNAYCNTCSGQRRFLTEKQKYVMHSQTECLVGVLRGIDSWLSSISNHIQQMNTNIMNLETRPGKYMERTASRVPEKYSYCRYCSADWDHCGDKTRYPQGCCTRCEHPKADW